MEIPKSLMDPARTSLFSGGVLVAAYTVFACSHFVSYRKGGEWLLLLFCLSETITAFMFLVRSEPESVSSSAADWAAGIAGTLAPLLLRPAPWGLVPSARYAIAAGVVLQLAGLVSLNRSIAVVAARRTIKTAGAYRYVRHPLYASYAVMFSGYVLMNTSAANVLIFLFTMALLGVRAVREEQHLASDPHYREYMRQVSHRVIPYIF